MSEVPDVLRELFQQVILNDRGVMFISGGHDGPDEDGFQRFYAELTKTPLESEVPLHVLHLTIARRIAHLASTKDIHEYAIAVAEQWMNLANEVKGHTYDEWRQHVLHAASKEVAKARARGAKPERATSTPRVRRKAKRATRRN